MNLFYISCYVWMGIALLTFFALQHIIAPFGRHNREDFGPTINARLAWFIMEIVSPLTFSFFFLTGKNTPTLVMWIFFLLWNVHYLNRSVIYPLRQKATDKKMPIAIMWSAIGFNLINGLLNGLYLGWICDTTKFSNEWLSDERFMIGIIVFVIGMFINIQADNVLLSLRKPGETHYKIPKGGLFYWISCPNLLGEMIEWTGFALMVWSAPALSFAIWTTANLLPRAVAHHHWYQEKFGKAYPKKRRAVLPGIL
jgi:3-oxo-5-alpha-steroid 4-dehydrogenase 1